MYFNNDNKSTNIDEEFENENILSHIIKIINKYKILIIIGLILVIGIILFIYFTNNSSNNIINITNYLSLNGEENITIYQGSDYIELGFEAYNSKNEDLTNKVIIKSNIDTSKIGEYEITYTIGDVTKTRKINVIEKPKDYTYIYLKTIDNNINVYLKVGENYNEPGYQVFSSTGKNLNNQVKVTGYVDTSKKGNYKLIYSVIDSNGVNISTSRTVIVMDTEINLSLSTKEYTNKDVTINIKIIDDYFDYLILPDNTKVTDNNYSYKVSSNGTYKFKTHNKKGIDKESSVEVKNIDKETPSGSCSGSYKDGKSTININAKDNVGIHKYTIDGISYTNNPITINKELEKVTITIYDKSGNTTNISCILENKNTNPLDHIYTSTNSHTNSINGIKYLLYNQADSRWGNVKYSDGSTIADRGCMITSVAVISSAYNESITPKTVFDTNRHNYPYIGINNLSGSAFKCKSISATNSKNEILKALSEGNPVVIKVYGRNKGGASAFTSSQHYMALIDYKDDKIFIGNSYSSSGYGETGWYDKDTVLTSVREVNICKPTQQLIDRFK